MSELQRFLSDGYSVYENVLPPEQCAELLDKLPQIKSSGTRTLLKHGVFRAFGEQLKENCLRPFIGNLKAVEGIYFKKTYEHNWAIRLHRDAVLPIKGVGAWRKSGIKEGIEFVRPPREFMDKCVAVRVQLDGSTCEDISVVPGSHLDVDVHERCDAKAIAVSKGGVLIFRPTIVHASSKLAENLMRRVLHYVYAPEELQKGYEWDGAI